MKRRGVKMENEKLKVKIFVVISTFCFLFSILLPVRALALSAKYPKIANYYLVSSIQASSFDRLKKYDLLILPMEAQYHDQEFLKNLKRAKPEIILLPYIPIQSVNQQSLDDPALLRAKMMRAISPSWWLKDSAGRELYFSSQNPPVSRPDIKMVNPLSLWQDFLPNFIADEILNTGLWDGVFFDMVDQTIDWLNHGDIDLDGDKKQDDPIILNLAWQMGLEQIMSKTRKIIGDKFMIINGSSYQGFQAYINGRMFEVFPTPWLKKGSWSDSMADYLALPRFVRSPPMFIINLGGEEKAQRARFGLASALLGDGYFSMDQGIERHAALYWFPEYEINLGAPLGSPYNLSAPGKKTIKEGVWRRDFEQGIVILNSSQSPFQISFEESFEQPLPTPSASGPMISSLTLGASEGSILLKPISEIYGRAFLNGSYVRIFNAQGEKKRNGFFAFVKGVKGRSFVLFQDFNKDGRGEMMVINGAEVTVKYLNREVSFSPFPGASSPSFAFADLNNDQKFEFIFGAPPLSPPWVKVLSSEGQELFPAFLAYNDKFMGGVQVASGDINGDGIPEIITGAGKGGGPHVRIFSNQGRLLSPGFFAFSRISYVGINLDVGDLDNDKKAEIIVGVQKGAPEIRVFNGEGVMRSHFLAFGEQNLAGVLVGSHDIDNDGVLEILAWTDPVASIFPSGK